MSKTFIGHGLVIDGKVSGLDPIEVAGRVRGTIEADAEVLIRAGGHVEARIHGRVVRIEGAVTGDVEATERAEVTREASLNGNVAAPRVLIADGAQFRGQIEMTGQTEPPHV